MLNRSRQTKWVAKMQGNNRTFTTYGELLIEDLQRTSPRSGLRSGVKTSSLLLLSLDVEETATALQETVCRLQCAECPPAQLVNK